MNRISATAYRGWAKELGDLEDHIETIQEAKKEVYAGIRKNHGKAVAECLKSAMRLLRMDDAKRAEKLQVDHQTRAILELLTSASNADGVSGAAHMQEEAEVALRDAEEHEDDLRAVGKVQSTTSATSDVDDMITEEPELHSEHTFEATEPSRAEHTCEEAVVVLHEAEQHEQSENVHSVEEHQSTTPALAPKFEDFIAEQPELPEDEETIEADASSRAVHTREDLVPADSNWSVTHNYSFDARMGGPEIEDLDLG